MEDAVSTLTEVVKDAGRVVSEAGLPDDLRRPAFERILDVLLADRGVAERDLAGSGAATEVAQPGRSAGSAASTPEGSPTGRPRPLDRIARRAGLDAAEVREVYRLDGDRVSLVVGDRKIDRNKSAGSRQITLLVAGGRQAAELEEWTDLARAREICSLYGRLDTKNYAATIKSMADVFNFHGQGSGRKVRLTMPGWDAWADLVRRTRASTDRGGGP